MSKRIIFLTYDYPYLPTHTHVGPTRPRPRTSPRPHVMMRKKMICFHRTLPTRFLLPPPAALLSATPPLPLLSPSPLLAGNQARAARPRTSCPHGSKFVVSARLASSLRGSPHRRWTEPRLRAAPLLPYFFDVSRGAFWRFERREEGGLPTDWRTREGLERNLWGSSGATR
jgi:hypothetical protein